MHTVIQTQCCEHANDVFIAVGLISEHESVHIQLITKLLVHGFSGLHEKCGADQSVRALKTHVCHVHMLLVC